LARTSGMLPVGVFRDAPLNVVADVATLLNPHSVQLHGREDVEYVRSLRRQLSRDCEIWTALSVGRDSLAGRGGDRILFDNGDGGTGRMFDWAKVQKHPELGRAIIAGGIGPANALSASRFGAYAIDVGSAVDRIPGMKSPDKIRDLFATLRIPSREDARACA